jgi:hypothetical protein
MTLLIEDTARNNLASWTAEAFRGGYAAGAVLSAFATPRTGTSYKQSAAKTVTRLKTDGASAWFDPMTHALQMPNVGDLRYYGDWDLWGGIMGALGSAADRSDHVRRVFEAQDGMGVPHLAPTILLHSAQSTTSQRALLLAQAATNLDPDCYISIAGDSAFWSGGSSLDAHVGALAQLEPGGWFCSVVRSLPVLPVAAAAEEVHGLCRTVRSLSEDGPVHISHGDLAALPAVVAGASSIGTGWDPRQRVCAYANYVARDAGGDGGQWFVQSTLAGLLSLLSRADAQVLAAQNAALATTLLPGVVPPGASEAFLHHASVLSQLVAGLSGGGALAYQQLLGLYASARTAWATVASTVGRQNGADAWLKELELGLRKFGATEGW